MKPSELLADGRDHIEDGWAQGEYRSANGSVCMLGALDRAVMQNLHQGGIQAHEEARTALEKKCREIYGYNSVPSTNDDPRRVKQDVLDLFDKTIIGMEEVGS